MVCSSPLAIQAADQFDSKFRAAAGLHSHVVHAALVMTDCVVPSRKEVEGLPGRRTLGL